MKLFSSLNSTLLLRFAAAEVAVVIVHFDFAEADGKMSIYREPAMT